MAERKWVVNASPLIVLANIAALPLLETLCTEIVVPAAVADEIRSGQEKDAAQLWLADQGQAYITKLKDVDPVITAWNLGAGESAVLTWAHQNLGYEAILDDRAA